MIILNIGLLIFLILASVAHCWGQGADAFAGKWLSEKRDRDEHRIYQIDVNGIEVIITETFLNRGRTFIHTYRLFTDKRGERNLIHMPDADGSSTIASQTWLDKGRLTIDSKYGVEYRRLETINAQFEVRQVFSLTDGGRKLKVSMRQYHSSQTERRVAPPGMQRTRQDGYPTTFLTEKVYIRQN